MNVPALMVAVTLLASCTPVPIVWLPWLEVSVAALPELFRIRLPPVPGLIV